MLIILFLLFFAVGPSFAINHSDLPVVCISVLIRNKEHSLPYFFGALERLDYPKQNLLLWIVLDHSVDKSKDVTDEWVSRVRKDYRQINYAAPAGPNYYATQKGNLDWPTERMDHVVKLKIAATNYAREMNADYIFYLDADVILINRNTLNYLTSLSLMIVAPMLNTTSQYSNFWAGIDERGYYKRVDDYMPIRNGFKQGVFEVPMVHSAVLVDLRVENTQRLTFDWHLVPGAPHDDIIVFALSAQQNGVPMHVSNVDFFGYLPVPRDEDNVLEDEVNHFRETVTSRKTLNDVDLLPEPFDYDIIPRTKFGFDEIYVINLLRRPERAEKMKRLLRIFNIEYRLFAAADGLQLNTSYLNSLGVKMLDGYEDPYHKRPLKTGEIGCFLSHFFIWEDMIKNDYKRILILEDDCFVESTFNEDLPIAISEADQLVPNWDLMFLGRKVLRWDNEKDVEGSTHIVWPDYSHWTISYALTQSGAKKFIADKPLSKMVAVDEYIPIMYNRNDNEQWLHGFPNRNLVALSTKPLLIHPQLYVGQPGYVTDTEASVIIDPGELASVEEPNLSMQAQATAASSFARGEL